MRHWLIIWDIDGTLMSCGGSGRIAMNDAFYEVFKIRDGFDNVQMAGRLDRAILRESLYNHGVSLKDEPAFFDLYGHHLRKELEVNSGILVYEGVREVLMKLSGHAGVICAVGTGNCEIGAFEKLKCVGLHEHFIFGGYGDHHDDRATLIRHIIDQAELRFGYKHDKTTTFVIGDTPYDIECGQAVGATTIAVSTGGYSETALLAHRPDVVLKNLSDTSELLKMMNLSL